MQKLRRGANKKCCERSRGESSGERVYDKVSGVKEDESLLRELST